MAEGFRLAAEVCEGFLAAAARVGLNEAQALGRELDRRLWAEELEPQCVKAMMEFRRTV